MRLFIIFTYSFLSLSANELQSWEVAKGKDLFYLTHKKDSLPKKEMQTIGGRPKLLSIEKLA